MAGYTDNEQNVILAEANWILMILWLLAHIILAVGG